MPNNSGQQTQSEYDASKGANTPTAPLSQATAETNINAVAPTDLKTTEDPTLNAAGADTYANEDSGDPGSPPPGVQI